MGTTLGRIVSDKGLSVIPQKTVGSPTSYAPLVIATPSSGATGNCISIDPGGSANPGVFLVTADPDNVGLLAIGDASANAAVRAGATVYLRGSSLQPGQAVVVITNDLRLWYVATRTANDALQVLKVGTVGA